jgi:hypothetical protein
MQERADASPADDASPKFKVDVYHRREPLAIPLEVDLRIGETPDVIEFSIMAVSRRADKTDAEENKSHVHIFQLPRSFFGDTPLKEIHRIVAGNFEKLIDGILEIETALFFTTVINFTLDHFNPALMGGSNSRQRIIEHHRAKTEEMLRRIFNTPLQKRGRFSPWTVLELNMAVTEAVSETIGKITADKVAHRLRNKHGEKAPPTGKALLLLVKRHGLKWQQIIEQAEKKRTGKRQQ